MGKRRLFIRLSGCVLFHFASFDELDQSLAFLKAIKSKKILKIKQISYFFYDNSMRFVKNNTIQCI